ncbi:hypothetical protein [Oleidesulfovibrio sp.]|uniref:hypothetical protein n=1 Tax=Oleidesulfovibrio sp. TaxID=2909707 RepID=UPI003A89CE94
MSHQPEVQLPADSSEQHEGVTIHGEQSDVTREECIVRLFQLKDISYELLDYLNQLSDEDFIKVWNGEYAMPEGVFMKMERLYDLSKALEQKLRERVECCRMF